jgi:tripartite-type tricarboxylate transporter receptor subunit TctC
VGRSATLWQQGRRAEAWRPLWLAINVTAHKSLPYDPATDFVPLGMVASAPFFLIVNPELPVNTVKELIAYAKANPGKLSYGSGGVGAPHHLYMQEHDRQADGAPALQERLKTAQNLAIST